ncbi:MAG TPA: ABC transporter permease, partial [Acidobacteriota bacterium]
PGFAATVLLTLGLAIGLNASLFTLFNVVVLRPWNVDSPGDVVLPHARPVGNRPFATAFTYAEYAYLRDHTETLAGLVARERDPVWIYYGEDSSRESVQAYWVSGNFFDVLGIEMALGRGFTAEEDDPGSPEAEVVISHGLWQRRFGGDPSVIGRTIRLESRQVPAVVGGVARRGFSGVDWESTVDLFVPLALMVRINPDEAAIAAPLEQHVLIAGRLGAGVSRATAEAELDGLSRQFRAAASMEGDGLILTGTRPIARPDEVEEIVPIFAAFGAALLLVLLLACANVGNLQLARALARRREIAVRLSLGAGRRRVIRQMLTEATFLALGAAALGLALARFVPDIVLRMAGDDRLPSFVPDHTVVGFAVGLALLSALLFALAPALRTTRSSIALAYDARAGIDRSGRRLRSLLLAAQIALSLTLLAGASLLTRGIIRVQSVELGFAAHETAVARLMLPDDLRPAGTAARPMVPTDLRAAGLEGLVPALDAALRASRLWPVGWTEVDPLSNMRYGSFVRRPDETEAATRLVMARPMSAASFEVLGLRLVAGRLYDDRPDAREAVVNETLARMMWPGERAVGQTILAHDEPYVVTGVVADSHFTGVIAIEPVLHQAVFASRLPWLVFRTDVAGAEEELRALVQEVDPRLRVTVRPVIDNIEESTRGQRYAAQLAWAIGALGLALATIGVFGVFAYAVEERRREVGIRLALGARPGDVLGVLLAANRWSIGGGLAVGLLLSTAGGFVLRSYLFGLSPLDPIAYLSVALILGVAAMLATVVPSRRALRVDPAITLRSE